MMGRSRFVVLKMINTGAFALMVTVNYLAVTLPINGVETGAVSDSYPNLFAPAGVTFSIWGLIYLLLAGFIIYQLFYSQGNNINYNFDVLKEISPFFILSSLANAAWIFSWHYDLILLSMLLMVVILLCLSYIVFSFNRYRLSPKDKLFVRLPFSVYFGWISVATIANLMVLLVSLGWKEWGIPDPSWTILLLLFGLIAGCAVAVRNKNVPYIIVLVWAYAGILNKHTSVDGFNWQFPSIVVTTALCIAAFLLTAIYIWRTVKRGKPFIRHYNLS